MKLYIVRHAIAEDRESFEGKDDSQRPLTDTGRKKMKKIAKGLRQFGVQLDMIVSSPYVRARDTAEILASEFNMKDKLDFSESLVPPGNFDKLIGEINDTYNVNSLALVGHEPSLSQLISLLATGGSGLAVTMKKGGVCCLSADALGKDGRATIEWLLTPAIMVDVAK
jgi:phosphohistidine phosphatase